MIEEAEERRQEDPEPEPSSAKRLKTLKTPIKRLKVTKKLKITTKTKKIMTNMKKSKEKNMKIMKNWINVTKYFNKGTDNDKNINTQKTDWNHKNMQKKWFKWHQRNQNQSQRDESETPKRAQISWKRPERLKIFGRSCSGMFWAGLLLTMIFSIDYSAS